MDKFTSKTIEVEAFQYSSGDWKVKLPDGNVENLTDDAFHAKYEPKGRKGKKDAHEHEDVVAEKGDRLVDGTVQDKQPGGHKRTDGKNAVSGDSRNDGSVEAKQPETHEVRRDARADEVKSAEAGKLTKADESKGEKPIDTEHSDAGARVKVGQESKNDPIARAEDKKGQEKKA